MADLQDAKNGMTGDGMNQLGEDLDQHGHGRTNRTGNGNGLGRGRGQGDRPEAPDDTATYNTKVKQQFGKGKAVVEGFAPLEHARSRARASSTSRARSRPPPASPPTP